MSQNLDIIPKLQYANEIFGHITDPARYQKGQLPYYKTRSEALRLNKIEPFLCQKLLRDTLKPFGALLQWLPSASPSV